MKLSRTTPALAVVFSCAACAAAQELVSFPSRDGGVVYAHEYGEGTHAVVLAHGGRFTKESWGREAPVLSDAGLRVLAIDFRGRGRSRAGSEAAAGDDAAHLDVLGAIDYLRGSGAGRISLVGASFGGWAVARAATEVPPEWVDRIVLLAHAPIEHPERLPGRVLFLLARQDAQGAGTPRLPAIRAQYERTPGPKRLVLLEGTAHAQHLFDTDQGARVLDEILRFLTAP